MPNAQVTVKDFYLPTDKKTGKPKTRWVIKDEDNVLYGVPPTMKDMVSKGKSYNLAYKIDNWQGVDYKVVEGITELFRTGSGEINHVPSGAKPMAPQSSTLMDEKQVDISVLSLVSSSKWLEKVTPGDVAGAEHVLRTLRMAWIRSKTRKPDPKIETGRPDEDMNDEIPY